MCALQTRLHSYFLLSRPSAFLTMRYRLSTDSYCMFSMEMLRVTHFYKSPFFFIDWPVSFHIALQLLDKK